MDGFDESIGHEKPLIERFEREKESKKRLIHFSKKDRDGNMSKSSVEDSSDHDRGLRSNRSSGAYKRRRPDSVERSRSYRRSKGFSSRYEDDTGRSPRDNDSWFPHKRFRRNSNFNSDAPYGGNYFHYDFSRSSLNEVVDRMSNFKEYVLTLDDKVLPEEAVNAYYEYARTFSRKQLEPFFKNYKECDWLTLKYHPLCKDQEKLFVKKCLQIRLNVFCILQKEGYLNDLSLDSKATDAKKKLHYFLIFVNILLEGGTLEELNECAEELLEAEESSDHEEPPPGREDDLGEDSEKNKADAMDDVENLDGTHAKPEYLKRRRRVTTSLTYREPFVKGRHHVVAFHIRTIPIDTTRDEFYRAYENVGGFLRAYLSEPSLGRRDFRRAYITFAPDCDVKEVTHSLNQINLRENVTLLARQSHELTRRVRCQELRPGCFPSPGMLEYDVELVVKLVEKLDNASDIFSVTTNNNDDPMIGAHSPTNDVVDNALADSKPVDTEAANEALIKESSKPLPNFDRLLNEQDKKMLQFLQLPVLNPVIVPLRKILERIKTNDVVTVEEIKSSLDPAILYLRVVHSVDYYGITEFPYEQLRNIRCSTITMRRCDEMKADTTTSGGVSIEAQMLKIPLHQSLATYRNDVHSRLKHLLEEDEETLIGDNPDSQLFTMKDPDMEVEKFIEANTQKITDQKYLCPLSMKKFKSPEYVRKHILSKHPEKIENVKLEAIYFNNFLKSRYSSLPFGFGALKQRARLAPLSLMDSGVDNHDSTTNDGNHSTKDSTVLMNENVPSAGIGSNLARRLSVPRNPRSYGKYTDLDANHSMFDL